MRVEELFSCHMLKFEGAPFLKIVSALVEMYHPEIISVSEPFLAEASHLLLLAIEGTDLVRVQILLRQQVHESYNVPFGEEFFFSANDPQTIVILPFRRKDHLLIGRRSLDLDIWMRS